MVKVITKVAAVVVNDVSERERNKLLEITEADSLADIIQTSEGDVASIIEERVFPEADYIEQLDVTTEVEE